MLLILNFFNSVINEFISLFLMWDLNFRFRLYDFRSLIITIVYLLDVRV